MEKSIGHPGLVKYTTSRGEVELTRNDVKRYFCATASDQEIDVFLNLCLYQGLNPWLREVHLIKYGNAPASMVVGWHVFLARAETNPNFNGYDVEVYDQDDHPYRGRSGQVISHATARVHRKDRAHPITVTVLFKEYSTGRAAWAPDKIPATMIRKVALEQALREAFTADFQGIYGAEEMRVDPATLPENHVVVAEAITIDRTTGEVVPDRYERAGIVDAEPEEPDDLDLDTILDVDAATERAEIPIPQTIAPFGVITKLAKLHGPKWATIKIAHEKKSVTPCEKYFGVVLKSSKDMEAFAVASPDVWHTGSVQLEKDLLAAKS